MRLEQRSESCHVRAVRVPGPVSLLLVLAGCANGATRWWSSPLAAGADNRSQLTSADTGFTLSPVPPGEPQPLQPPRVGLQLAVLHVQIPAADVPRAETIWNHVREDVLDAETRQRLRQNGLRIGVGHERFWEPIKLALDAIDGRRVMLAQPVSMPPGFPIALEMDSEPRTQTLFSVDSDGVLSGSTWPFSRNVLRVAYAPDPQDAHRLRVSVTPQVRQEREGWRWVRTESGFWQVPRYAARSYEAAGFVLTLEPQEYVVIAASDRAVVDGLLGRALLTAPHEDMRYYSYVFLQPGVREIGARGAAGNEP